MLRWALIFLITAVVSAVFGFTNIAPGSVILGKVMFGLTTILFAIFLAIGVGIERRNPEKL